MMIVYIVFGSNLVFLLEQVNVVLKVIVDIFDSCIVMVFLFYCMLLFGLQDQFDYLNVVVVLDIVFVFEELFNYIQCIEL